MKFLSQLFGGKPPKSPAERFAEFQASGQAAIDKAFADLSGAEQESAVWLLLLNEVSSSALVNFIKQAQLSTSVANKVYARIAKLIDDGGIDPKLLMDSISDVEQLLAIAAQCSVNEFETQVLQGLQDQALIIKLCQEAHSTKVRQLLAEKIDSPDALRDLAKTLKQKDKNAYKTIKSKLDNLRAIEQEQQKAKDKALGLIEEIKALSIRPVDKESFTRYDRVMRRWLELSGETQKQVQADFDTHKKVCDENLEAHKAALAEQEAHEKAVAEVDAKRVSILEQLDKNINAIFNRVVDQESDESVISDLKSQWNALKSLKEPASKQIKDFTQRCEAYAQLLVELGKVNIQEQRTVVENEGSDDDSVKKSAKQLRRFFKPLQSLRGFELCDEGKALSLLLEQTDKRFEKALADQKRAIDSVTALIRKANGAAEAGRIKQAIGIRHSIDEKLASLDEKPAFLEKKLEGLDEAIQKLVDWQAYAVVPKKQELIAAMEKLVGIEESPEALATKIKKLQDEWKALGQSGADRKQELWETFSELAEKAYAPCKSYYDGLAEQRRENLKKREMLVDQLKTFYEQYDWEQADWKHVETILRGAKKELHSYVPVERAPNKPVMALFDEAHQKIQAKLDDEYGKNKAAKEQLIAQIQRVVEQNDLEQAIDAAKRLQAQWKNIGRCHYKDNDALWTQFRAGCDQIFAKKNDEVKAQRAEVDGHIESARACIEKAKSLLGLEGEALLAARSEKDQLQQAYAAVEGVPEKVHRAITRDLNKVLDEFDKKIAALLRESASQGWQNFFSACEKINHYHREVAAESADLPTLKESVESFVAGVSQWPEGGQSFVKQRLLQVNDAPHANTEENLRALKLLCIRAEILADHETPEEDKSMRMEYQVSLLQQGMGGQRMQGVDALADIAKAWCAAGPVDDEDYQSLFKRFYASWREITAG